MPAAGLDEAAADEPTANSLIREAGGWERAAALGVPVFLRTFPQWASD